METHSDSPPTNQGEGNASVNGTHAKTEPPDGAATDEATARAEEMVDRWSNNVSNFTSVWGRRLYRAAARVREEVQDFWAEAQSIRHGDQP